MGSTGRGIINRRKQGENDEETFGIKRAVVYKGKIPEGKGLEPIGNNKVTLKIPATDGNNILFQFKLSKDTEHMTIIGYKNGIPELKAKVAVDSANPSLDAVIATGSKSAVSQAIKMKDLFSKSTSMKENQLKPIANKLLKEKKVKGGTK